MGSSLGAGLPPLRSRLVPGGHLSELGSLAIAVSHRATISRPLLPDPELLSTALFQLGCQHLPISTDRLRAFRAACWGLFAGRFLVRRLALIVLTGLALFLTLLALLLLAGW